MAFGDHVLVKLGLDTKTFNKGLTSAQERAKKFGANFKGAFVGALGTAVIANASKRIIDFGASIGDLSDRIGVTSEFLQKLQFSAEQNGSSAEEANKAISRLAKSIGDAKDGLSTAVRAFDNANVTFKNTDGTIKSVEQVMYDLADGLSTIEDDGVRVKTAFDLMGRSGLALTQFMNGGSDAMKDFGDRAEQLGFIISNEKVKALQDASGELEKLGRQFKVFGANILPPLFEKFKQFVNILQDAYRKVEPFTDVMIQAGKALATYWIAGKVIAGVTAVIGGFAMLTKVIRGTAGAVALLNTTTKLNPIGLIASGIVLALPLLDKFINKTDKAREELEKLHKVKIDGFNKEIERLGDLMAENAKEAQEFNKELAELLEKEVVLSNKEELDSLRKKDKLLKDTLKAEQELAEAQRKEARAIKQTIEDLKKQPAYIANNLSLVEAVKEEEQKLAQIREEQTFTSRAIAKAQLEIYKNTKQVAEAEKVAKDLAFARQKGIGRLLRDEEKELINLERKTARVKAINEGGLEAVKVLDRQFAIEDKIVALYKSKKMSLEEAFNLANRLVDAGEEEKRLIKQANDLEGEKNRLTEEQRKEVEKRLEALKKEQAIQQANQAIVNQELAVLRLRARGQGDLADLLQARIDNEKALVDIQNNQGLALGKAVAQRREELALLAKIKANKIAEAKADIVKDAVALQAGRKLGDAKDFEDKKRIRAGREIARIDKQIAKLEAGNAPFKDRDLAKLKDRRQKQLELVLDDNAKKQIAGLEKQKLELKKEFEQQQRAIGLAEKKLKQEEAKLKAEAEKVKLAVEAEGKKQEQALKAILNERNNALEQITKTAVDQLKKVQAPVIKINNQQAGANINQPKTAEAQKVFVVNQLEQGTQNEILRTLKGYFVNQ